MAAPPLRTDLANTYPNPSNGVFRIGIGALWDYLTGLLGATGNPKEALLALGVQNKNVSKPAHSATPVFDCALFATFKPGVVTANISSMTFQNMVEGEWYTVRLKMNATGGYTVAVPSIAGGNTPKITGTYGNLPNQVSMLTVCYDATDNRVEGAWTVLAP